MSDSSTTKSARLANRAAARSDSWVALAKAHCPSLGQGCRKSGLILMVKSPGFLHPFRDMSVWSVWLFFRCCCLLSRRSSSGGHGRPAAGSQLPFSTLLAPYLLNLTSPALGGRSYQGTILLINRGSSQTAHRLPVRNCPSARLPVSLCCAVPQDSIIKSGHS